MTANIITAAIAPTSNTMHRELIRPAKALSSKLTTPHLIPCSGAGSLAFLSGVIARFGTEYFVRQSASVVFVSVASQKGGPLGAFGLKRSTVVVVLRGAEVIGVHWFD